MPETAAPPKGNNSGTETLTQQQLLDKRNNAITNMRSTQTKAENEGRDFTPAERDEMDGWMREAEGLNERLAVKKKDDKLKNFLAAEEAKADQLVNGRRTTPTKPDSSSQEETKRLVSWNPLKQHDPSCRYTRYNERLFRRDTSLRGSDAYSNAMNAYIYGAKPETAFKDFDEADYRAKVTIPRKGEERNYLQSDDDVRGGYLNVSEVFMEGLLKEVDDATWIYRLARSIIVAKSEALGIRKLTAKMSTWQKGSELSDATVSEDDSIRFGKRILTPHYYTGAARLSRDLMRLSTLNPEQLLYSEFARDLAYVIEQEAINGTGVQGILGCMVADADGISTARDFSSDTTTTTFKFETFIGAKYNQKPQYRQRARWMFNRTHIAKIAKIRTDSGAGAGTGNFIWQPSMVPNLPDTMLGLPIDENEFFPTATGASVYFGMLAVWEFYMFAIGLDMEILRLVETKAHLNQIQYVGRVKIDGMPILEEAFTRLQFAAS